MYAFNDDRMNDMVLYQKNYNNRPTFISTFSLYTTSRITSYTLQYSQNTNNDICTYEKN